jgi:hypothetical protein
MIDRDSPARLSPRATAPGNRPRWLLALDAVGRPNAMMLVWGLVIGLLGALALLASSPQHWLIESRKAADLRASMAVLKHGGPLLLGREAHTGKYYAVGVTDDEGIYVYLPLLSRFFGVADPVAMLRYSYVALMGLTTSIYPIVFYKLTRSRLAGLAAPVLLLLCVRSFRFVDIYWIPAWGMLTFLPLIYLLARDWPRFGLLSLAALSLVASWLTSIRSEAGLPIVIAAAIVLLARRWRWWRVLPALALLAVTYISINTFMLSAIRAHREHWLGSSALGREQPTSHPFWHTVYIGVGYLPNSYGLKYFDTTAIDRVRRVDPNVRYLSPRYETILREAYFGLVRDHPVWVASQYAAKALVATADTAPYLLLVLLTMPAMLLLGPERRIRRRWVMLTLPALIIMFLPSLVAIPLQTYEQGLYGVVGLLGILGLCCVLERVEAQGRAAGGVLVLLRALPGAWSASRRRRGPLWRSVRISWVTLTALVALSVGAHFARRSSERWRDRPSGVLIDYVPADLHMRA